MTTQQCLPMPGLNATPGTLMRLQPLIRRLTQDWKGFTDHYARIMEQLEEPRATAFHVLRGGSLVLASRIIKTELTPEQISRGILPYRVVSAEDDETKLADAGKIHPATVLQNDMAFIFSDGRNSTWFSTKEGEFSPTRVVELMAPASEQQILLPLYTQAEHEAPEKLGVLSLEGKNLFWKNSTCQTDTDRILEIMLILSMLSSGISSKLEAGTDALTRLVRKREFYRELNSALRAVRDGRLDDIAVIMVDIDRFKGINDTHGHILGDRVLETVAGALADGVRTEQKMARLDKRRATSDTPLFDTVARYGGEEFGILVMTTFENALKVAERLRAKVEEIGKGIEGISRTVTCSFGVASLSQLVASRSDIHTETGGLLVGRADEALYAAKRNGRNRVESYQRGGETSAIQIEQPEDYAL